MTTDSQHLDENSFLRLLQTKVGDPIRTLKVAALYHGSILNYSKLGRRLGISHHAAKRRIKSLEKFGMVRLLYPLPNGPATANNRPKSPKLFFHSRAVVTRLLGVGNGLDLPESILGKLVLGGE